MLPQPGRLHRQPIRDGPVCHALHTGGVHTGGGASTRANGSLEGQPLKTDDQKPSNLPRSFPVTSPRPGTLTAHPRHDVGPVSPPVSTRTGGCERQLRPDYGGPRGQALPPGLCTRSGGSRRTTPEHGTANRGAGGRPRRRHGFSKSHDTCTLSPSPPQTPAPTIVVVGPPYCPPTLQLAGRMPSVITRAPLLHSEGFQVM